MAVSRWSDLPGDILRIICHKLIKISDIKDYVYFGAVCSHWRTILWLCYKSIPSQLPLLMFPNIACTSSTPRRFTHGLLSMNSSEVSVLPNAKRKFTTYFSLNHGWILTQNTEGFLYLVNPFSPANSFIKLPRLKSSVELLSAVLSDNPTSASKYVVMVTYKYVVKTYSCVSRYGTVFFRSGEKRWRSSKYLEKISYYKDQFYGVNFSLGGVVSCDTSLVQPKITKVSKLPVKGTASVYLVESSGELLCLVWRWYPTSSFQIFKLCQTETLSEWDEVKDLKGHALFIADGGNTSFSVLSTNFCNCRANGIYFIDKYRDPRYVKLFDLDKSSVVNLFNLENYFSESCDGRKYPAIWIQPTLNMSKGNHACDAEINKDSLTSRCELSNSVKKNPRRKRLYR